MKAVCGQRQLLVEEHFVDKTRIKPSEEEVWGRQEEGKEGREQWRRALKTCGHLNNCAG